LSFADIGVVDSSVDEEGDLRRKGKRRSQVASSISL